MITTATRSSAGRDSDVESDTVLTEVTTGGAEYEEDRQMIEDAGFEIEIQGAKEPALA